MSTKEQIKTTETTGIPGAEELNRTEEDLLTSLLECANFQADESLIKTIHIQRGGKHMFSFRVHPLSEDDILKARKKATTYAPNPAGKNLPKIEKDYNPVLMRCHKIYMATVKEDQKKIWENKKLMDQLDIMTGPEVVDKLLLAGEKDAVIETIDEISGYDADLTEYAKN